MGRGNKIVSRVRENAEGENIIRVGDFEIAAS